MLNISHPRLKVGIALVLLMPFIVAIFFFFQKQNPELQKSDRLCYLKSYRGNETEPRKVESSPYCDAVRESCLRLEGCFNYTWNEEEGTCSVWVNPIESS